MGDIRQILIVNLGGIGDVLLSAPALKALRAHYARARIVFLGVGRACEAADELGFVDETIVWPFHRDRDRTVVLSWVPLCRFLLSLRRRRFDLAVNMRTIVSWKSALKMGFLFGAIGARRTAGRNTKGRGFFFNIRVPEPHFGEKPEGRLDIDLVAALGVPVLDDSFRLGPRLDHVRRWQEELKSLGLDPGLSLVGIHLGGMPSRRWPTDRFREAMRRLSRERQVVFILTGGPEEAGLAEEILIDRDLRTVDLSGRTTFRDLVAVISLCRLFISNDTGAMHVATALGVPLVAIFGGGSLGRYDPRAITDRAEVVYEKTSCAPCDRIECRSLTCLKQITPDAVVTAVDRLWERTRALA